MNPFGFAPGQRALRKGRVSLAHHYYLLATVCECRIAHFADATRAVAAASVLREERIWRDSTPQCWVLMPDHLPILLRLGCTESLPHLMNRMKSVTAHAAIGGDRCRGRIWMRGFHDRAIRSEEDLQAIARYVIENPIRAGLADMLDAYPFWGCALGVQRRHMKKSVAPSGAPTGRGGSLLQPKLQAITPAAGCGRRA